MICGCCWGLVCLGVCADFVVWGLRKEFARHCICRKGERGGALCGFGLRVESLGEMKNKYIYLLFSALSLWIYFNRKCALGESGRKRAVGGSVRASGGRACLSVRRRGERHGALDAKMCVELKACGASSQG